MRETSESACILLAKSCIQIPILSTCPHAHVIVAPVVKTGGFCVRVPGHLLRDFDAPAVGEIVGDAGARKLWQPIAVSIPGDHFKSDFKKRLNSSLSSSDINSDHVQVVASGLKRLFGIMVRNKSGVIIKGHIALPA